MYHRQVTEFLRHNSSIHDLIQTFFNDGHTYYDATDSKDFEKYAVENLMPKSFYNVQTINKRKYVYLFVGSFIGLFGGSKFKHIKTKYQLQIAQAIMAAQKLQLPLWVDVSRNQGGDDNVMLEPFKLLPKNNTKRANIVQVSGMTNSAGEMVAATLIYDYNFIRVGPRTSGSLSISKNFVLDNGRAFLGVTTSHYTTPGGHTMKMFYL